MMKLKSAPQGRIPFVVPLAVYCTSIALTLIPACTALLMAPEWTMQVKLQAITIAVLSAIATLQTAISKNFSLSRSIFWVWVYIFLGLAQLYQLAANAFPWRGTFNSETVAGAQRIIIIGCLVVYVASSLVTRQKRVSSSSPHSIGTNTGSRVRYFMVVALGAYCAVAACFVLIMGSELFHGKTAFQNQLISNAHIPGSGSLYFVSVAGAFVLPAAGVVCRKNGVRIPIWLLTVSSLVAFIVTNPLTGSRFLTGTFLLAMAGAFLVGTSLIRFLPAGLGWSLITVFPSLDLLRGDGTGSNELVFALPQSSLLTFDFDSFEMLLREVSTGRAIPEGLPTHFELFVAPFLRWVPFLSDSVRGDASGPVVAKITNMGFTNVSMPLWGEAHLVGGVVGVIVAFACLGIVLGLIHQPNLAFQVGPRRESRLVIDASVAALLIIVLRGSLYEVLGYLLFALAVAFSIWLISRYPKRTANIHAASERASEMTERPKTIAFYLPQFHTIPENDEWWGKGFTEWSNVDRAQPAYVGHQHPREPAELGRYDLSDISVMHDQAALAKQYDVDAFCFYFYSFGGKRLLEKPLNNYLKNGPDFPFCISWANESWTRRWDGKEKESLIAQAYPETYAEDVFMEFLPLLQDPRYLRVAGAAVIMVHRVDHLPDGKGLAAVWNKLAEATGVGPIHLVAAETKPGISPVAFDFDAVCEFPPVGSNTMAAAKLLPVRGLNRKFRGRIMSYPRLSRAFMRRKPPEFVRYRGVVPSWDNTARRRESATFYVDASPFQYRGWLQHARAYEQRVRGGDGLVFINAWNEWAEGAYLEPDTANGMDYLNATSLVPSKPVVRAAKSRLGLVSGPWIRSLALAGAGSALQLIRRLERLQRVKRSAAEQPSFK